MTETFPNIIQNLPATDVGVEGVNARLLQGPDQQVVFMEFGRDVEVPEHSHEAQWGIVVAGEMTLTVDGRPSTLRRGDSYFIPAGVPHSARIKTGYSDVTLFNQVDRYS
ncbi:MAG: cupin domain-containing protein [candidate division WOR-3 bacterium]|nr:MAG: cupin domain-containing protein [candidate division WOR-3 bacterium]